MSRKFIAAAVIALSAVSAAHAETYVYMCKVGHTPYPVTVDEEKATLTWRDETYTDLTEGDGCRYSFVATHNGVTATLCTSTQGVADFVIGHDHALDCQMPDNPSPQVYRQWLRR